ncbi:YheU family protein [Gilvimarinus polysaccharolyticus]|uniref:YheU family protein n=1 Tax=Gilvimarinus polysaccharolyticus TaxID=863921 RepID=UPI0009FE5F4E
MIIPHQQLARETLDALIEEFVTREGTEYGEQDISLDVKVEQVRRQLERGKVVIVFDPAIASTSLMPADSITAGYASTDREPEDYDQTDQGFADYDSAGS